MCKSLVIRKIDLVADWPAPERVSFYGAWRGNPMKKGLLLQPDEETRKPSIGWMKSRKM